MKSRFDELLPFYVNGTLSADDRSWIESYLREHPPAEGELRWLRSVQTATLDEAAPASSEVGLERVMQRIRAERPRDSLSFVERVRGWFSRLAPAPMRGPALAGALAVIALQTVVISSMLGEREDTSLIRSPAASGFEHGPYVKLNFKPDAREADIRMLLTQVQGSLAAGPGQLGDYYLRVPAAQLADATTTIGASAIVEGFAVVEALPPRP
jgi:hypothetical protein